MQFYIYSFLFLLLSPAAYSQFSDDFSDGNISNDPPWSGDVDDFLVNDQYELQLNAPSAGLSTLFTQVTIADSSLWELYFRLDFPPSGSNHLRIVLQSDDESLTTGNGYVLYLGETGNEDALQFYRLDAGVETLLATGSPGAVASAPEVRLRVSRQTGGIWKIEADYSGGFGYQEEFSLIDNAYTGGDLFFGFQCAYTSTRRDKFYFDDVVVEPLLPDTAPPVLLSAEAVSAAEIVVSFDEMLDTVTAGNPGNYIIDNGIGAPVVAIPDESDRALVRLMLTDPLASLTTYTLTVEGVSDPAGNYAPLQTTGFTYIEAAVPNAFDILINEIMADPKPPVALPEVEYVELFNRSDKIFDLEGFTFSNGGDPQALSSYTLLPGAFVILCDDADANEMAAFGEVLALPGFPGLVNSGDELFLSGPDGQLVHQVNYGLSSYGDSQKEEGGWSLELVNPQALCSGKTNYRASESLFGGTPGQPNSVLSEKVDQTGPNLIGVFADADTPYEVLLFFDESLDKASAEKPDYYEVFHHEEIFSATLEGTVGEIVRLLLTRPLETGIIYEVAISPELTDCLGNSILQSRLMFALPESIEPGDLVINEILFDPLQGGADFLELFNRSDKVFNLRELVIGNLREGVDTMVRQMSTDRLIFPSEFIALTPDPGAIQGHYQVPDRSSLLAQELPGFSNDRGNVTIFRNGASGNIVIDAFDYEAGYHHPLLDDTEGVSLERLDAEGETQDVANWHSAAATAGYATPGSENSQKAALDNSGQDVFFLPEKAFSPDGDGYQDYLLIQYQLDRPGYTAQVRIYDAIGQLVKSLFNNELLATEGFLRWDGETDRGEKARIGIYVIWIGLFHPDGMVAEFREGCIVAARL